MERRLQNSKSLEMKLQNALKELLLTEEYENVSVKKITEKAEVNRTTFYLLYGSKDELLEEMCGTFLNTYIDLLLKSISTENELERYEFFKSGFRELTRNRKALQCLKKVHTGSFDPYYTMEKEIFLTVKNYTEGKLKNSRTLDSSVELFARYFSVCAMQTVDWWTIHGCDTDSVLYIYRVINGIREREQEIFFGTA